MPTARQRLWAIVFILAFALTVVMFGWAAQDLDIGMLIIVLIPGSILIMGLSAAATGLVAWLYRPFRRFFAPINLGLLLLVMLAWSRYFYERTKFPEEFEQVKAYVTIVSPALETYYGQHGHYPDSLNQLGLSAPIPSGLVYQHILHATDNWAPSCYTRAGGEIYTIDFEEAHLCPDGNWFVDD
jgi:hypothetical protein